MLCVDVPAGPIDYVDTGGDGPVIVFGHGLLMNETHWRKVIPLLDGYRCIAPTLPLGAHRKPMRPDPQPRSAGFPAAPRCSCACCRQGSSDTTSSRGVA